MEGQDLNQIRMLCDHNPRFRRLYEEHTILEKQLEAMDQRTYLTVDEELERKKVQKLKLASKDEMLRICRHLKE